MDNVVILWRPGRSETHSNDKAYEAAKTGFRHGKSDLSPATSDTLETKKFLHLQRNTSQALIHRSRYPDKNSKQANYPFFIWEVLLAKIGAAKSINCELRGIIRPNDQIHTAAPKGSY